MTSISSAIGQERRSRVSGYKIKKGFFDNTSSNLPQVIAIFGEANTANQPTLSTLKTEITSAKQAAELYGYGSPIHQQMRILRPQSGDGVGGIPTIVFPQLSSGSATPSTQTWVITGTATKNATHTMVINGRKTIDFQSYSFSVAIGDTGEQISTKMANAINGVLSSPVTASDLSNTMIMTTKWAGLSSGEVNSTIDTNGVDPGLTYVLQTQVDGAGVVSIADALNQFGNDWYTIVLNPYSFDPQILSALESFNGFPDDEIPTGRYEGRIFKPFVSLFGSTLSTNSGLSNITDIPLRTNEVTNVLCVAPNSSGFVFEAAANVGYLLAITAQNTPELDVNAKSYPDMPIPFNSNIGDMADYNSRDFLVKKGCSTVILENARYQIQDLVTTYHPEGETPLQYAYPRNLIIDWNIKDAYVILEKRNVRDHVLIADGQVTDAPKSVKPKQWKAVLYDFFVELGVRALIRDPDFSKESLRVQVSPTNPDRFETFFRYRRTGVARIQSTDVEAGF